MANSELKPCPFCRCDVGDMCVGVVCEQDNYAVVCNVMLGGCGATAGFRETPELAIEAWNTRAERTCRPNPIYDRIFECDVCGEMDTDGIPDYCPGCGARVINE